MDTIKFQFKYKDKKSEQRSILNKKLYHDRIKEGLCPSCGDPPGNDKFIMCFKCRRKNASRMKERYDRKKINLCQ